MLGIMILLLLRVSPFYVRELSLQCADRESSQKLKPISTALQDFEQANPDATLELNSQREYLLSDGSFMSPENVFIWNRTYGGQESDQGFAITACSNGGYVLAGSTSSSGNGGSDGCLIRINEKGERLWNRTYGGADDDYLYDVIECSTGGYALVGVTRSFGGSDTDMWLVRTDSQGGLQWNRTYNYLFEDECIHDDSAYHVAEHSLGGLLIAGSYVTGLMIPPVLRSFGCVLRTDSDGILQNSYITGMDYDLELRNALEWWYDGTLYYMGVGMVDINGGDLAIGFTSEENVFYMNYGGNGAEYGYDMIQCSDGGFAAIGRTTSYGAGMNDVWLLKLTSMFEVNWTRTFGWAGDDIGFALTESDSGGFLLIGYTDNNGSADTDGWVIRTDDMGIQEWNSTFGWDGVESFDSLAKSPLGGYIVAGTTDSMGEGGEDILVTRICPVRFDEHPVDQFVDIASNVSYDLNVSSVSEIDRLWLNDTSCFVIDQSGLIQNSTELEMGTFNLEVGVNDTRGEFLCVPFTIFVSDFTPPTWIEPPTDINIEFEERLFYDLNATDPFGLDTWWINGTSGFSINAEGIVTNTSLLEIGIYHLTIFVNDTYGNVLSTALMISVQDTTDPTWDYLPVTIVVELGQPLLYDFNASDRTMIASYWVNDSVNFFIDNSGYLSNATTLSIGSYPIEVRAIDEYDNYCEAVVVVSVVDTTPPTWIAWPSSLVLEYGTDLTYNLDASDLSGISQWWVNDTVNFETSLDGSISAPTMLEVGTYGLEVRAYDLHGNYNSVFFTIAVRDTIPPILIGIPEEISLMEGQVLEYQLAAWDISGISFWSLNDSQNFVLSETGLLSNKTPLLPGRYDLNISVQDPYQNQISVTVSIVVQAVTTTTTTTSTTTTNTSTITSMEQPIPAFFLGIGTGVLITVGILFLTVLMKRRQS